VNREEAFLQAILEDPENDVPRLIFADWLEEHGQPDRAEFIRLQCELARMPQDDERRAALEKREAELRRDHREEWGEPLRGLVEGWSFRRGFVDGVGLKPRAFLAHAEALFRVPTVRDVALDGGAARIVSELAACPHLARIHTLYLHHTNLREERAGVLWNSPHWMHLRTLVCLDNVGDTGVGALARSPLLGRLTELTLVGVSDAGLQSLPRAPQPSPLQVLGLSQAASLPVDNS
jgi:uncharacterized protein (TIGR02996 family)